MYEQSARWHQYYQEPDPVRRRRLLDELCMTEPDDGANEYRLQLYQARHGQQLKSGGVADRFLFHCVSFIQLYQSSRFFRRNARKEADAAMKEMLADQAAAYGEAGERALYWEMRNAAARYLKTCEGSSYNRQLFGLMASKDDGRQNRACQDMWKMGPGLAGRIDRGEAMRVWSQAMRDACVAAIPGAEEAFRALEEAARGSR